MRFLGVPLFIWLVLGVQEYGYAALVLAIMFGIVSVAAFAGGEPFLDQLDVDRPSSADRQQAARLGVQGVGIDAGAAGCAGVQARRRCVQRGGDVVEHRHQVARAVAAHGDGRHHRHAQHAAEQKARTAEQTAT